MRGVSNISAPSAWSWGHMEVLHCSAAFVFFALGDEEQEVVCKRVCVGGLAVSVRPLRSLAVPLWHRREIGLNRNRGRRRGGGQEKGTQPADGCQANWVVCGSVHSAVGQAATPEDASGHNTHTGRSVGQI